MRNLLALVAAAFLTLAGVGAYLGWYTVESSPARAGHHAVSIDIDGKKIGEDLHKGGERLHEALDNNRSENKAKQADGTKNDSIKQSSSADKTSAPIPF